MDCKGGRDGLAKWWISTRPFEFEYVEGIYVSCMKKI